MIKENFNPLIELVSQDSDYLDLLPYHIGLEIESNTNVEFINKYFNKAPCLAFNHTSCELRVKFDIGINGLCQLYVFCMALTKYSRFNIGSGIHYNIDTEINQIKVNPDNEIETKIIITELEKWNYKGEYNNIKAVAINTKRYWCNIRDNRLEFRVGEMSFDFDFILNRIQSCNHIIDSLLKYNKQTRVVKDNYEFDDIKKYLNYIDVLDNVQEIIVETHENETIKCY